MVSSPADGRPRAGNRDSEALGPRAEECVVTPGSASLDGDAARAEAELARLARGGDRGAFSQLYECYASTVHGVLLSMVPVQDAHDLVQEVFLLALRSIEKLERPERVGAWLCTIARNRARDAYKSRSRSVSIDDDELERMPEENETAPDQDAQAEEVLGVIKKLPESYRETLILRLVEGLTGPEIAAQTGLTHGSVRVNLHRGMKLLREGLERVGWRPNDDG